VARKHHIFINSHLDKVIEVVHSHVIIELYNIIVIVVNMFYLAGGGGGVGLHLPI